MGRWIVLACVLVGSLACVGFPTSDPHTTSLAWLRRLDDTVSVAPGLDRVLLGTRSDTWTVRLDGEVVVENAEKVRHLRFLEDGTPFVSYARDGRWFVWVDHERFGPFDEVADRLEVRGHRWSVQVQRGKRWHTLIDGELGASWEMTSVGLFSPNGAHVAWLGQQDGRAVVFLNGRELAVAPEAYLHAVGDDGTLLWSAKEGDAWRIAVGEARQPGRWERVRLGALHQGQWAAVTQNGDHFWVVQGAQRYGPQRDAGRVHFTDRGEFVWYEAVEDQGWRLHVGSWAGPWVADIGEQTPTIGERAPVEGRILWWTLDREGASVYLDEEEVGRVLAVSPPLWFAGDQPAWIGMDRTGWRVFVGAWATPPRSRLATAVTSDDGEYVAVAHLEFFGLAGGMTLYRVGEDEPLGEWPGPVVTEAGAGPRFEGGFLRFAQGDGGRLVRRDIPLDGL